MNSGGGLAPSSRAGEDRDGAMKMELTEKQLCSLVAYLNRKRKPAFLEGVYPHLVFLMTRPDKKVVEKGRCSKRPGAEAQRESYITALFLVLERLNEGLGSRLEARYATQNLWEYRPNLEVEPALFPVERKNTIKSQITYSDGNRRLVRNPYYQPHTNRGRGFVKTPWGNFLVSGEVPEEPPKGSAKRYWFWVLAVSLTTGKFTKLRSCRGCEIVFLANDLRKATCSACGDIYNRYRAEMSRFRKSAAEQDEIEKNRSRHGVEIFCWFLERAKANQYRIVGKFIKGKVPGEWKTVNEWLSLRNQGILISDIWARVPEQTKADFRDSDWLKL